MKNIVLTALFFAASSLTQISTANATMWATGYTDIVIGSGNIASDRSFAGNALGAPDGTFYSPGVGGEITFTFDEFFDTKAKVVEVTYGDRSNYVETAEMWVSNGSNNFEFVTTINNFFASTPISLAGLSGPFSLLKIVDTSYTTGGDGFDIDAVGVSPAPIPEPATMILFGLGLAGLLSSSARKKFTNRQR